MNYTPLPVTLTSPTPVPDLYVPETPPAHSPFKKALATILIAMFLGIGTTYLYFRNMPSKQVNQEIVPTISVIPSPLPTIEQYPTPMVSQNNDSLLSCTTDEECMQGSCVNNFCKLTDSQSTTPTPSQSINTTNPNVSCPSGTIKVCQAGECECINSNQ